MPGKHSDASPNGTDLTYHGPVESPHYADYQHTESPDLHTGYTAAGVARRVQPAHRARGYFTYYGSPATLRWYSAYDQS